MSSMNLIDSAVYPEQMQETILEVLSDGVYFVDRDRRIVYWNKAAERLTGYTAERVVGTCCADGILIHVDDKGTCLCKDGCPLAATMQDGNGRDAHVFMHHADGHRVPVHVRSAAIHGQDGNIIGSVEVFSDDTDRVGILERLREMEQTAMLDELTGLANRRYFNRAFDACLANFKRNGTPFGLTIIDIDHFKRFNDTYGHDVGDTVLRIVARTLTHNCRPYDTPVRWGGEEFAVISDQVNEKTLYTVAERMRVLIAESHHTLEDTSVSVSVSIGASMIRPEDDATTIVKRADANLYNSKRHGRNRTTVDGSG